MTRDLEGVTECGKRHGTMTVERCTLEQGHDKAAPKKMRRTRLKESSIPQTQLEARWAGVKDGILTMMRRYEPDGKAHCESCGLPGDARTLDAHHLLSRAQGGSYEARNCVICCNRFSPTGPNNCHDRETGTIMWSSKEGT